jgi:hypothetical protein
VGCGCEWVTSHESMVVEGQGRRVERETDNEDMNVG